MDTIDYTVQSLWDRPKYSQCSFCVNSLDHLCLQCFDIYRFSRGAHLTAFWQDDTFRGLFQGIVLQRPIFPFGSFWGDIGQDDTFRGLFQGWSAAGTQMRPSWPRWLMSSALTSITVTVKMILINGYDDEEKSTGRIFLIWGKKMFHRIINHHTVLPGISFFFEH